MPAFNRYRYDSLVEEDAIRYVVLDPALDPNAPLICTIVQTRLSAQDGGYCAISYVWGKPEFLYNLEIREDSDTSYLRITASVDNLLRTFRSQDQPCKFWIDALCIDQDNETEKGHQIPLMGRIYEQATEVRIWLGPADGATQSLFKFFAKISQVPHLAQSEMGTIKQWEMSKRFVNLMNRHVKSRPGSNKSFYPLTGPGLLCLHDFFDRPWFFRRWVIQEACLASQSFVHCGHRSIPLSAIISAAKHILVLDLSWYTVRMTASLHKPSVGSGILELLWNFHEGACLEKKDRIAALFGLIDKEQRFSLDYSVHWTELYKQVAEFVLKRDDHNLKFQLLLHLFEFGPVPRPGEVPYPSWVPDWSQIRQRKLPYYSNTRNPDTYEPYPRCPKSVIHASFRLENDGLRISWDPSAGGLQGRRVIYAAHFHENCQDKEDNAKGVLQVLHELFPSILTSNQDIVVPTINQHTGIPTSSQQILTLATLVKIIVKYRHREFNQESKDASFQTYLQTVGEQMYTSPDIETLFCLKKLGSLLQEYSLYELEPFNSGAEDVRIFGFSTGRIQVGDNMIPLWQPESLHHDHFGGRPGQLKTMLAVSCTRDQEPSHCETRSGHKESPQKGRIVGPAVSIISEGDFEDGSWDSKQDVKDAASMYLC
ncbi:HET domain-containing protein [Fusarium austroafricanum]|uniref:HET domain-containing protein n=1 Tax=Fusarium austroafricanum TaxID=2364996 RepID=A0A8H4NT39_9HYPO|nr:HET domain-containing protein [Fusarium austroafricanum]